MTLLYDALIPYGWTAEWEALTAPYADTGWVPARVHAMLGDTWRMHTPSGEGPATVTGKLRHLAGSPADLPAVGDWVMLTDATGEDLRVIHLILPRHSKLSRRAAGDRDVEQVMATNVDRAFVVCGLDGDFNVRRLERYGEALAGAGIAPVILLTKSDLHSDPLAAVTEVSAALKTVPVHAISVPEQDGVAIIDSYMTPGETIVLLGSSGAGKSTLLNHLNGLAIQKTQGLRNDSRGRHTTTHRALFVLPNGALVIDSPGIRELQLWGASESGESIFPDIDALAESCRFSDCQHETEPGCAIREGLADGSLDADRHASWQKLHRERLYAARMQDAALNRAEIGKWKAITKSMRGFDKGKP